MNSNLGNLFTGDLYIHKGYGLSLVPVLLQSFIGVSYVEKKLSDMTEKVITNVKADYSQTSDTPDSENKTVAVITFNQPVLKYSDYWCGWLGTQAYIKILERIRRDDSIAGVVMEVDSGGGQVYGTPEFFEYIQDFTQTKPLVVYTGGLLCSGAYYFAAAASWIVAHKRADAIGSIGVYTVIVNYDGIIEKLGGKIFTIYAEESSEKNKNWRAVTEGGTEADLKQYAKEELSPIAQTFKADMISVRPQIKEEAFKGGTWTGEQSIEMGLADENGSLETAIAKVFELASKSESNKNNNNQNSKKKTMSKKTKSFPLIQGILGSKEQGFATISTVLGNKGIQITEANLETIEKSIEEKDKAVTTANGKVTTAEGKVTELDTAVSAAITAAGLDSEVEATATTAEKITLLQNKVIAYGKKPAAAATKPKSEGD
ncbi:MAG: S49 family peptidase, partial [Bacteroidia bacterium]